MTNPTSEPGNAARAVAQEITDELLTVIETLTGQKAAPDDGRSVDMLAETLQRLVDTELAQVTKERDAERAAHERAMEKLISQENNTERANAASMEAVGALGRTESQLLTAQARLEAAELAPVWSKDLPNESGLWWWWNEDEDSMPIPVTIMYGGRATSTQASKWWRTTFTPMGFWMPEST